MINQFQIRQRDGYYMLPLRIIPQKILLPRFDTYGDIVLFEGFIATIRSEYPSAEIYILVRKGYDELSRLFPLKLSLKWLVVDLEAYILPSEPDIERFKLYIDEIKNVGFDVLIVSTLNRTWLDNYLLEFLPCTHQIMISSFVDDLTKLNYQRDVVCVEEFSHETDKYQKLYERITGNDKILSRPKLEVQSQDSLKCEKILSNLMVTGKQYVVCMPAGTHNQIHKVWPLERYAAVLSYLHEKHNLTVVLVAHESEKGIIDVLKIQLFTMGIDAKVWSGRSGELHVLAAILNKATIYLGNDSGPMHIAAALGTAVVGVFGGGTYPRFIPVEYRSMAVVAVAPCFGCYWDCIFETAPCMKFVSIPNVIKASDLVLSGEVVAPNILNVAGDLPVYLAEMIQGAMEGRSKLVQYNLDMLMEQKKKEEIYQSQLDCILNSVTWRITSPIRVFINRFLNRRNL